MKRDKLKRINAHLKYPRNLVFELSSGRRVEDLKAHSVSECSYLHIADIGEGMLKVEVGFECLVTLRYEMPVEFLCGLLTAASKCNYPSGEKKQDGLKAILRRMPWNEEWKLKMEGRMKPLSGMSGMGLEKDVPDAVWLDLKDLLSERAIVEDEDVVRLRGWNE